MKPYQRENSGPQQQQQQQKPQGVMQNQNNHRFTSNQQLQQQHQQQLQKHQQQLQQQQQNQQQLQQQQQNQQQLQQQQQNQQQLQQQQPQNVHESTPSRVNTSQGSANTAQGPTSMYTGPSAATQGVFPSKPPVNISMSGNQGQPRPQSAVYPPSSSSSPRMVSQASGYPVPAPRSVPTSMTGPGMRQAGTHYQYYPSLSGSETDVSTSTENLTQEERYVLRHMERQDPQGEENGDHNLASYQYMNRLAGSDPSLFQNNPLLRMQLHHYQQQMLRPSLFLTSGANTPMPGSRMATPTAGPMMGAHSKAMMDSPASMIFPNAIMPRSLHDDIWPGSRMRPSSPMVTNVGMGGGTMLPMSSSVTNTSAAEANLSKLNPSVYSHPNAQDPVLMMPKSYQNHRDLAVLGGRRANMDVSSSGAFFDPRAVSKVGKDTSQMEILAQLTREMRLQQQAGNGMFSYSSDAVSSSSGGSNNHINQLLSPPMISGSTASGNVTSGPASSSHNNSNTSPSKLVVSSSPGYNAESQNMYVSGNNPVSNVVVENRRQSLKANSTSSLNMTETSSMLGSSHHPMSNVMSNSNKTLMSEVLHTSLSQPDLFTGMDSCSPQSDVATVVSYAVNSSGNAVNSTGNTGNGNGAAAAAILDTLKNDNRDMKAEILELRKKVSKVAMLEEEMAKVHQAYQSLLKHSEKREQLEKTARAKLQSVILNLSEANKEVSERHEAVMSQLMSGDMKNQNIPGLDSILRGEIMRKDALIRQLMEQNKMLLMAKERQEVEMAAQGETLEEQRAHIQILDTALSNAQSAIVRLEEENRVKEGYAERVKLMTKSLEQLQAASEKRETMEKKLRVKLEEELKELRAAAQAQKDGNTEPRNYPSGADSLDDLRRKFGEAEEKLIRLEAERTQWEQRYFEESAMRQVAIDAASIPKDAKIAALEKNSAESEKLIADARSDKMKQFEELQNSQRKVSDLESMLKTLETNLSEREATIRILKSNKTMQSGNFEDFFAAVHAANSAPVSQTSINVSDHSNILSIPIQQQQQHHQQQQHQLQQQQQQQHRIIHNKSLSHLMSSSPMLTSLPTVMTPSSFGYNPPSYGMAPSSSYGMVPSSAYGISSSGYSGNPPSYCVTPSSYAVTPSSYIVTPSTYAGFHHVKQLSTPNVNTFPSTSGSRLAPSFLSGGKGRSLTPSAEMLLLRSATPTHLAAMEHLKSGRRDSAPGDVFSTSMTNIRGGPTLINTSDLYSSVGTTLTGGGTIPKMSMAVFKDAQNRATPNKQFVPGGYVDSYLDDTIGSFMGSVTPTRIDGSPSHSARHEASKSYDGTKNYIEGIWRI